MTRVRVRLRVRLRVRVRVEFMLGPEVQGYD